MYKTVFVLLALAAITLATPNPKPGVLAAYTAPVIAPAVVTAQSAQVVARNYNGLVSPVVAAAPFVRAAPFVAAPHYNPYISSPYVAAPLAYY